MVDDLDVPLDQIQDLRHLVRKLSWFQLWMGKEAEALGEKYNYAFVIDNRRLAVAFLKWAEMFEMNRAEAPRSRTEFAVFSAGLMLRELLRAAPVKSRAKGRIAESIPADPMARICEFWPEGFFYTTCCLALVRAILKSDFNTSAALSPSFEDLRVWESFRENADQDVGLAVSFFDVFLGGDPNWTWPGYFLNRPALRDAGRLPASAGKLTERS